MPVINGKPEDVIKYLEKAETYTKSFRNDFVDAFKTNCMDIGGNPFR